MCAAVSVAFKLKKKRKHSEIAFGRFLSNARQPCPAAYAHTNGHGLFSLLLSIDRIIHNDMILPYDIYSISYDTVILVQRSTGYRILYI